MSFRTHGIAHFSIPVSDVQRSAAFYQEMLGLELILQVESLVFLRSGRDIVILAYVPNFRPLERKNDAEHAHHAFIVESRDFEPAIAYLESKNVHVFFQDERPLGSVLTGRSAYFLDPDENVLEIIDLQAQAFRAVSGPPPNLAESIARASASS